MRGILPRACESTLLDFPWKEEGALKEPHSQTMMPYGKGSIRKGERILWPRQDERRGRSKEDRPTDGGTQRRYG